MDALLSWTKEHLLGLLFVTLLGLATWLGASRVLAMIKAMLSWWQPCIFRIINNQAHQNGYRDGVGFIVPMVIVKRVDEELDTVHAFLDGLELLLQGEENMTEWRQPTRGTSSRRSVFGYVGDGDHAGKTLVVVIEHNGHKWSRKCRIV